MSSYSQVMVNPIAVGENVVGPDLLTIASAIVVVVSIAWIVVSRLVLRILERAPGGLRRRRRPSDIWKEPPD